MNITRAAVLACLGIVLNEYSLHFDGKVGGILFICALFCLAGILPALSGLSFEGFFTLWSSSGDENSRKGVFFGILFICSIVLVAYSTWAIVLCLIFFGLSMIHLFDLLPE